MSIISNDDFCTPWMPGIGFGGVLSEIQILCPQCKDADGNVHLVGVIVNRGGKITIIDDTNVTNVEGPSEDRGVTLRLLYQCEFGHFFTERIQFHKGNTYRYLEDVSPRGYDPGNLDEGYRVLWRD